MTIIKKIQMIVLVSLTGLYFGAGELRAERIKYVDVGVAKQGQCPEVPSGKISVLQFTGGFYQNQNKPAFDMAREKSKLYGIKMPVRQGNMGRAVFRNKINVYLRGYPGAGCIVIESIKVKVFIDHKIEIAREYKEGSCMYSELYSLEIELMRQDEKIINDYLVQLNETLMETIGKKNVYGPIKGVNVDSVVSGKREKITTMIEMQLSALEDKIFEVRRQTDLPEYFDEIVETCSGG